jgi:hypothetical protein
MINRRIRLSTRFLPFFKVLSIVSLLIVPCLLLVVSFTNNGDWSYLLQAFTWTAIVVTALLGMQKLRTVVWDHNQLVVNDQADLILLPEEIEDIELKMLIGVHEVTLREPHPYLGESFLFQASLMYFFRHNAFDEQMHELRQRIARARHQGSANEVATTRRPMSPPQLGGA